MIEVVCIAALALVAIAAIIVLQRQGEQHGRHIAEMLARQDAERYAWARERWELTTRIQAPELVRATPPAPPDPAGLLRDLGVLKAEPEPEVEDEDIDEINLVGTTPDSIPGEA